MIDEILNDYVVNQGKYMVDLRAIIKLDDKDIVDKLNHLQRTRRLSRFIYMLIYMYFKNEFIKKQDDEFSSIKNENSDLEDELNKINKRIDTLVDDINELKESVKVITSVLKNFQNLTMLNTKSSS